VPEAGDPTPSHAAWLWSGALLDQPDANAAIDWERVVELCDGLHLDELAPGLPPGGWGRIAAPCPYTRIASLLDPDEAATT
jgi:hypothetical protein